MPQAQTGQPFRNELNVKAQKNTSSTHRGIFSPTVPDLNHQFRLQASRTPILQIP